MMMRTMKDCLANENHPVSFINDMAGKTIAAASRVSQGEGKVLSANVAAAKMPGQISAKNALANAR
jgi:hypothetical protein